MNSNTNKWQHKQSETHLLSLSGTRCSPRCSPTPSIPAWSDLRDRIGWEKKRPRGRRRRRWVTSAGVAAAVVKSIAGNTFDCCRTGLIGLLSDKLPSASPRTPPRFTIDPLSRRINERGSAYLLDVSLSLSIRKYRDSRISMLRQMVLCSIDWRAGLIWNRFNSRERTPRIETTRFHNR